MYESLPIDRWAREVEQATRLAQEFADAVRARLGPRVTRIVLFGSVVRGEWSPDSDIDVLVLLDTVDSNDVGLVVRLATRLGVLGKGLLIQPVILPEEEFEHLKRRERRFALEVERTGKTL